MRPNRITTALQAIGPATTQEITRHVAGRPECVSAQLSGLANRGLVRRAGERCVEASRWHGGTQKLSVTVWELI